MKDMFSKFIIFFVMGIGVLLYNLVSIVVGHDSETTV